MARGRARAAGLLLTCLWLIGSAAVAQVCNVDLTVELPDFRLNPGPIPETVLLTLENTNPAGGLVTSFDKVFYRPNCRAVDSSRPPDDEASCGSGGVVMYDDGLAPTTARPFSLPSIPLVVAATTCPGVAVEEFYPLGDPNPANISGVEWLEVTFPGTATGSLKLIPGQSCDIVLQLQVTNFPETFDPVGEPLDNTVRQIAGTQGACLVVDNPGLPFDQFAVARDTAGPAFALPFCGLEVDKQVSCDGGQTWVDVDPDLSDGSGDGIAESCTGWDDPNAPPEVKVRYLARNNSTGNFTDAGDNTLTSCELTDSNTAILGAPVQVQLAGQDPGEIPGFPDAAVFVIHETPLLECDDEQQGWLEPNTATLDCLCPETQDPEGPPPIEATDQAEILCEEPRVTVAKVCLDQQAGEGLFSYGVTVTNTGEATLTNCVLDDPTATCAPLPNPGPLAPGQQTTTTCTSTEPVNTVAVTCDIVGATFPDGSPKTTSDEDMAECPVGDVEVVKECASNNGDGTYTYDVKVTNTGLAGLEGCFLTDTNPQPATCTGLSQTDLDPGQMATASCTSVSDMNMVRVTCGVVGSPDTVTDESTDGCVTVDKQISCDGGQTWFDQGYNDAIAESCIGWSGSEPGAAEIVFRYAVKTGVGMTQCVLTDTNPTIPAAPPIGDLPSKFDGVVYTTPLPPDALLCDEVEEFEPDTATVTCVSVESGRTVTDQDSADLECQEPKVEVVKACASNNGDGTYTYDVTVTNTGEASLVNCRLEDTNPVPASCTSLSQTSLQPGQTATASCDSGSDMNMVKVTCDIEGAFFPDGSPKTTSDESMDGCISLDKRISCDGGQSFVDVGYNEPLAEACIGWSGTDAGAAEIVLQYAVRTGVAMSQCVLAESNPMVGAVTMPVSLPAKFDGVVYTTPLPPDALLCDEVVGGEPDTATVTCVSDESGATVTDEDSADLECQDASVDVIKECASNNGNGTYGYNIKVTNTGTAELVGCTLTDTNPLPATCTDLSQTDLGPGQMATASCTSASNMNMVRVDCEIAETSCEDIVLDGGTVSGPGAEEYATCGSISVANYLVDATGHLVVTGDSVVFHDGLEVQEGGQLTAGNLSGAAKTVTDEGAAGCVDVDKQISCDGGATWSDMGYNDAVDESCTGWSGTGPGADEILFRYLARTGSAMTGCVLTDTNGAIPPAPPIGALAAKFDGIIYTTPQALFCDDVKPGEPDTATLTCQPVPHEAGDPTPPPVSDMDSADLECQEPPQLVVTKECRAEVDPQTGDFVYDVTISNTAAPGAAPLTSCEVTDTTASGCDRAAGQIPPIGGGQSVTITCTSASDTNTASVTCQGPKGPLTDDDSAACEVCKLEVLKTCEVAPPLSTFVCDDAKPLDVLVMIWNGTQTVDVTAWKGSVGSTVAGEVFGVTPGQEVRISGFASAPGDVIWEIFAAGTGNKLGESKFHLSCSDADMNGPEDCGKPQGDGKRNEPGLLNSWLLAGLEGNGLVLDCTLDPLPATDSCVASGNRTLCTKRLTELSVRITGEDCSASSNTQDPGSWDCTDHLPIDPGQPVQVHADGPGPDPPYFNMVEVDVGDILVLDPTAVGRTIIEGEMTFQIFQGGLAQEVRFHTSCSQDLATGDKFGGVQVWAFENPTQGSVQFGAEVVYEYKITNLGNVSAFAVSVVDDPDPGDPFTVPGSPITELMPNEMVTLTSTRTLTETTTNVVTVSGAVGSPSGQICEATDDAIVTFEAFLVAKECAPQDASGDNAVTITLENVGNADLVCEVSDPLANYLQSGVQLDVGAIVVLNATVSGLGTEEINTVTVDCVDAQTSEPLPSRSATDLCEVP